MRVSIERATAAVILCGVLHFAAVVGLAQAPTAPARTAWDGVFTAEQADRGRMHYAAVCSRCHGASLEGGMGASLVGTPFWNKWRQQSVADLLAYVSKNMPMGRSSESLSAADYADIVSYLLKSNDLPAGRIDLTADTGANVLIVPQGGGSTELAPGTLARVVGCLKPQAADRTWHIAQAGTPERVKAIDQAAATAGPAGPAGDRTFALKFVLQSLTPLVGQRVSVIGLLLGEGGAEGINVSTIAAAGGGCD